MSALLKQYNAKEIVHQRLKIEDRRLTSRYTSSNLTDRQPHARFWSIRPMAEVPNVCTGTGCTSALS